MPSKSKPRKCCVCGTCRTPRDMHQMDTVKHPTLKTVWDKLSPENRPRYTTKVFLVCRGQCTENFFSFVENPGSDVHTLRRRITRQDAEQEEETESSEPNVEKDSLANALTHYYTALQADEEDLLKELSRLEEVAELMKADQPRSGCPDVFESLAPVPVQAMAAYDVRMSEMVNGEVSKLQDATNMLNSILASLNLPADLQEGTGGGLPQSLVEKSNAVIAQGGIDKLKDQLNELPDLLQRNRELLNETECLLNQERLKTWNCTPSVKRVETLRFNLARCREIVNNSAQSNLIVHYKFSKNEASIELLCKGPGAMNDAAPSAVSSGVSSSSSAFRKLKELMEVVDAIKAERAAIESELKSATFDIKYTFLTALDENGAAISSESLGSAFGPMQRQVQESLRRQENLVANIQTHHSEFVREKTTQQEQMFMELAAAHDAFMELQNDLKHGIKLHVDLAQLLVNFRNKIPEFLFGSHD